MDVQESDQESVAIERRARPIKYDYSDQRVFLTWEQLMELDKKHIIGSHTLNHVRMVEGMSEKKLEEELVYSKSYLEKKLGHDIPVFTWVGGEENTYTKRAAEYIKKAGYKLAFLTNKTVIKPEESPFFLNRTNIEARFSLKLVRYLLCGFQDPLYQRRRNRIKKKILLND
jgi:peptidoglycan/xylan/chitin deacetylase (PgdA/CDA1 family)